MKAGRLKFATDALQTASNVSIQRTYNAAAAALLQMINDLPDAVQTTSICPSKNAFEKASTHSSFN
jgi:hypothetical protein